MLLTTNPEKPTHNKNHSYNSRLNECLHEDAPRGMEFLYSLNRLNVSVLVARTVFMRAAEPSRINVFSPPITS